MPVNPKSVLWLASVLAVGGTIAMLKGPDLPAPVQIPSEISLVMEEPRVLRLEQPTIGVNWPIDSALIRQPPVEIKVSCEEVKEEVAEEEQPRRHRYHRRHHRRWR